MESMVRQSGADELAARGPPDAMASQRARGTHVMRTGQPAARIDTVLAVVQPPSNLKTLSFVEELVVEGMDEGPPWAPPAREPRCRDGAVPQCRECRAGKAGKQGERSTGLAEAIPQLSELAARGGFGVPSPGSVLWSQAPGCRHDVLQGS